MWRWTMVALVALAGCSSQGDLPGDGSSYNASAQCVMACQARQQKCLAQTDSDRRFSCDSQAASRCDSYKNEDARQACRMQAQACYDQSPLISCSQDAGSCMASCGGG
ncbi:hypothetical protein [Stenotrophomonas sp. 24(2023)]|uniref:hypothetical protein n=1 Tax=Stenotrophomonas sp. 24(2023) TaxID=3068324 RepID=UPI0027DF0EC8|nr:hypothetical protein [Stenotrophomonas sp. 24(2023)]WMJ69773.1 hypothetical protein Q9R17_01280 [Stenotrophomonas sp. 24(2023)]